MIQNKENTENEALYFVHDRTADNQPPYIFTGSLAECQKYIKENYSPYLTPRRVTKPLQEHPDLPTEKNVTGDKSIEGFTGGEWKYKVYDTEIFKEIEIGVDGIRTCVIPYLEAPAEANAQRIVKAVNNHDALVSALNDAHYILNNLCDNYCRDENGYLKYDAKGWDADLDIRITNLLSRI